MTFQTAAFLVFAAAPFVIVHTVSDHLASPASNPPPGGLTITRIATQPPGVTAAGEDSNRHGISAWRDSASLPSHSLPAPGAAPP